MDPLALLARYFPNPEAFRIVVEHSRMVAAKA
ncbi:MAG: phosphohydrolase, partial [Geobacter sp.]|nr:phosphohydrolase [Geobacter sp.]